MTKEKTLLYINFSLLAGLALFVAITIKTNTLVLPQKVVIKKPPSREPEASSKYKRALYDIRKLKPQETVVTTKKPASMNEMYATFSKEDVGDNMCESWSKADTEDKKKFMEILNKDIENSKNALKANPLDKKAKHKLYISETLKNLAKDNFDYKIAELPQKKSLAQD